MANEPKPQNKKIRKVNLSDLQNQISKRGRKTFFDADLKVALEDLLKNDEAFIWEDGFVSPEIEGKDKTNLEAKMRSRVASMAKQIAEANRKEFAISVLYLSDGNMLVKKRGQN